MMADWKRRKRVRTMRRVLREHGSPVPKRGCVMTLAMLALALAAIVYGVL
jgi:hypothetical protein